MNKKNILGITPFFELIIRKIYYSNNIFVNKIKQDRQKSKTVNDDFSSDLVATIKTYLDSLNIKHGDILIVHTSADKLSSIGLKPVEVIQMLRLIVGEEGTLVLPSFPLYDKKCYVEEKNAYIYKPRKTLCSTGIIPNIFIRMPGVVRSQFPWNSLAAQGPHADEMMKNNLCTDLAHGKGSAWDYCMQHNAKILLLGVSASHTTTMVHVAEDVLDDSWPISNWYETKKFIINNMNDSKEIDIRVRRQYWAKYNASWYRSFQLKKQGILKEDSFKGFNIGYIEDSKEMVEYIINRSLNHKPFFVVPKRYYKK